MKFDKPTSRRSVLKLMGGGALSAPFIIRPDLAMASAGEVNISTYDKFLPKEFVEKFQKDTGIQVNIRLTDDQGKLFNSVLAEGDAPTSDIVSVSGHRVPQWVESNLLTAFDLDRLRNWKNLSATYTDAPWINYQGQKWAMPHLAGYQGLSYNTDRISGVDSWAIMFDEKYRGQTSYIITDFLSITMRYLGYDGELVGYVDDDAKSEEAMTAARDHLIANKAQVRKYYSAPSEVQQMLLNEDIYLAHAWSGPISKLILDGAPVRSIVPKEGTYGFCYNLNIVRNAPNAENAYKLLDAILGSPEAGAAMTRGSGFISTTNGVAEMLTEREQAALSLPPEQAERVVYSSSDNRILLNKLLDQARAEILAA
ncbi:ABC transporter substrate-binding protein [Devosia sp. A369]